MRGVSLEEISAATRISTRFLEALESDQWDQLPGGVFNRGFIRSVARFLGLDEDSLVAEYALETKDRTEIGVVPDPPMEIRRNWGPAVLAVLVLAAILAGGWFFAYHYGARIVARFHRRASAPAASAQTVPAFSTAAAPGENGPAPGMPAPLADTANSAAPPPAASSTLELKIEAGRAADLKVIADGRTVYDGHVDAGNVMRFDAQDSLEITSSDSSALLLDLNGQTVPPMGLPGQFGTVTLTRKDLKSATGGPH